MSIDIAIEKPISFNEAAKYLPEGRRPSFSTWWRWFKTGIAGVKLDTILIGGQRCTSAEAVARFFEGITAAKDCHSSPVPRTSRQRKAAIAAAERELADAGI